jgi:acetyl-CoA C-acetyltransferase
VIVGAAQVLCRDAHEDEPREPVALIAEAMRLAVEDSGAGERLLRRADSIRCVPVIGWHYPDAAALVAEDLELHPRQTVQSAAIGGDGPQVLLNDTARAIAAGELDIALLGGGEAGGSMRAAQLAGRTPPWRHQGDGVRPTRTLGEDRAPLNAAEVAAGLAPPACMYALIESAVRADNGTPPDVHLRAIAGLWSRLSAVASENPFAWIRREFSPDQIATPTAENRLVSAPYTKLLTANIQVNMATGLIVTSAQAAQQTKVPRDRWVFIHAGAQANEEWHVSERDRLARSPAIDAVGRAALVHAQLAIDDVAHVDLYSCFPSAVQIAAAELGLRIDDPTRPLSMTGGLTFAGGPGNNYSGHAIATLTHRLRENPDTFGLASAVGWYLTKHAIGIYSGRPPRRPFALLQPQTQRRQARRARSGYVGTASVEAYTVTYGRECVPESAIISALTPQGERALLRTPDGEVIDALLADDPAGAAISIDAEQRIMLAP